MMLLGSYLGWAAYRTGSTRTSIVCHLVNNAAAIGMTLLGSEVARREERESTGQMLIAIAIVAEEEAGVLVVELTGIFSDVVERVGK